MLFIQEMKKIHSIDKFDASSLRILNSREINHDTNDFSKCTTKHNLKKCNALRNF